MKEQSVTASVSVDLSGLWQFSEDFGYGVDKGVVSLQQVGNSITGTMVYEECIDGDTPFVVCVDIEGHCEDKVLLLKGVNYELFDVEDDWTFLLEERKGVIVNSNRIEGHSIDEDGVTGTFTLLRTSNK